MTTPSRLVPPVLFACLLLVCWLTLAACSRQPPSPSPEPTPAAPARTPTEPPTPTPTRVPDPPTLPLDLSNVGVTPTIALKDQVLFGFTYAQPDGNRLLAGHGHLPNQPPLRVPLDGIPRWVVAAPVDGGSLWVAVLEDGRAQAFLIFRRQATPIQILPGQLPPGMPPLLMVNHGVPSLVTVSGGATSLLTHPVVLSDTRRLAFIETNGDLVLWENGVQARMALDALPDARILQDEHNRLLLLTGATEAYPHGVLGDQLEASSITLLETRPTLAISTTITLPPGQVVEGLAPIWADLDGDGQREIIVSLSDENEGARLAVYREDGPLLGTGPAAGRGFQWRHALVVGPFAPGGGLALVDVLTPHTGGILEFFTLADDGSLELAASQEGYSTHAIGSRNLDMALAADFDSDPNQRLEILVPNQAMSQLAAFRLGNDGPDLAWSLRLPAKLSTNLAGITFPNGELGLGVGVEDGTLLIWLP